MAAYWAAKLFSTSAMMLCLQATRAAEIQQSCKQELLAGEKLAPGQLLLRLGVWGADGGKGMGGWGLGAAERGVGGWQEQGRARIATSVMQCTDCPQSLKFTSWGIPYREEDICILGTCLDLVTCKPCKLRALLESNVVQLTCFILLLL